MLCSCSLNSALLTLNHNQSILHYCCLIHCLFIISDVDFKYDGQDFLFKKLNFGIDMQSRSKKN
jgi:hypothetical protein